MVIMQLFSPETVQESLYSKAVRCGLTHVVVNASSSFRINFQGLGRSIKTFAVVSCRGSDAQEEALRNALEPAEAEDLDILREPLGEGDDCPDIKVFSAATGSEKLFTWPRDDPKVYMLYFWASWSEYCQAPIVNLLNMKARNPSWQGRVEVVTVSVDDSFQTAAAKLREKGWSADEGFWGTEECFRDGAPSLFSMHHLIDTCVLIKKGKIVWRGYHGGKNFEPLINQLLEHDELPRREVEKSPMLTAIYQGEELDHYLQNVETLFAEFLAAYPTEHSPFFVYTLTTTRTAESARTSAQSYAKGSFLAKLKPTAEAIVERLRTLFPAIEIQLDFQPGIPAIVRGDKCALCIRPMSETEIQYLCPYCEPKHYHCQDCEYQPREGSGSARLAHPHKLYKITPASGRFEELRFGANLPIEEPRGEDPTERVHSSFCDNRYAAGGCDGKIEGRRFKCAHCYEFDLCEACERLFWQQATEEMKAEARDKGHREDHVMLTIPFP